MNEVTEKNSVKRLRKLGGKVCLEFVVDWEDRFEVGLCVME